MPDVVFQERAYQLGFPVLPIFKKNPVEIKRPSQLYKNKEGAYEVCLADLDLTSQQHYQFFDGDVCVLEIFKTSTALSIQVNTDKQLNISGDIAGIKTLSAQSAGPIAFQSSITCEQMHLKAHAMCFNADIAVKKAKIDCGNGLAILKEFSADVLQCDADFLYQSGKLNIRDQLSVNAAVYEQTVGSATDVKKCRLVVSEFYLDGKFSVTEKAVIISDFVSIGENVNLEAQKPLFKLPADTYFRAKDCILQQYSQLDVLANDEQQPRYKIDFLNINNDASCNLSGSYFEGNIIRNNGQLNILNTEMSVNRLSQSGQIDINSSRLFIKELCDFSGSTTLSESEITTPQFNSSGTVLLNDCLFQITNLLITAGQFKAQNKTEIKVQDITVHKEARFDMKESDIVAQRRLLISGDCHLDQVKRFEAECAYFSGSVAASQCYFTPHILEFNTHELELTNCQGNTHALKLASNNSVSLLKRSRFSTQILVQQGKLHLQDCSDLFGGNKEASYFLIEGEFNLSHSTIVTKGIVYFKDRSTTQQTLGAIQAKHIFNMADMTAELSLLFSRTFRQENASLTMNQTRLYAADHLSSTQSNIDLKQSKIVAKKITHTGALSLDHSTLQSENNVIQGHDFQSPHIEMTAKRIALHDNTSARGVQLSSDEIQLYDAFNFDDSAIMAQDYVSFRPEAVGELRKTVVTARIVDTFADIYLTDSQLQAEHHLITRPVSHTTIEGTVVLKSEHQAYIQGNFNQVTTVPLKNTQRKSAVVLSVKNDLDLASTTNIHVAQMAIEAKTTRNRGLIQADESFQLKGDTFYNQNSVSSATAALYLNYAFANLGGDLSTHNTLLHANTFNLFGSLRAKENYTQNGFFSLNMGLISASNAYASNLLSFNCGLVLPNFSANPKYWFSANNLSMLARTTLGFVLPDISHTVNLAFAIPSLISGVSGLYQLSKKYNSWDKIKDMPLYEIMPIACQFKSALTLSMGAVEHCKGLGSEFKSVGSGLKSFNFKSACKSVVYNTKWAQLGKASLGILGGHYVDDSLVSINTGVTLAQSTAKSNLFDFNGGFQASLQNHSVNSRWMVNAGFSGGDQSNFSAAYGSNYGTLYGHSSMRLDFDTLHNEQSGKIWGQHLSGHIKDLSQEGELDWKKGSMTIDHFKEGARASTSLSDMYVKGEDATFAGRMRAQGVYFDYDKSIEFMGTAHDELDNTQFKTQHFSTQGDMHYKNYVVINAEKAEFLNGSQVAGAVSPEQKTEPAADTKKEENKAPESSSDTKTEEAKAVEPAADVKKEEGGVAADPATDTKTEEAKPADDIKPTHVLLVNSQSVLLDGKLTGGDYTQISGIPVPESAEGKTDDAAPAPVAKCDSLVIGEHAQIDLTHGSIASKKADISGETHLNEFNVQIDSAHINQGQTFALEKSAYTGQALTSGGTFNANSSLLTIDSVVLGQAAEEHWHDTTLKAKTVQDDSQLHYAGQVATFADRYEHGGYVSVITPAEGVKNENIFYVETKSADLHGGGKLDQIYYNIEHFSDRNQFLSGDGAYSNYAVNNSLMLETKDGVCLSGPIKRDCNITIKAADIALATAYTNAQRDLTLISTVGDVSLLSDINAQNLYVQSEHDIWTNHAVNTGQTTSFNAKGGYYNLGGSINGDTIAIKASEIKNISTGSAMAKQAWSYGMGSAGIINGRTNTYLEATEGNIENHGGLIRAGEYTQLIAKGNVINTCNVRTYRGAYDVIQEFDPGLIAGGNGSKTEGIGLYIKAGGMIISDASDFVSNGANYLEADQGFNFQARQHTYVSDKWETKKWYGKKEKHESTSTTIKGTVIHSASGRNILRTEHGGVNSVATQFSSPGGTDIYSRDNVKLYSLKSRDSVKHSESTLWGLSKHSKNETHQSATPTLFIDNGVTRGAYFVGAGDLEMKAKKRIQFGLDILDHEITEKSRSVGLSVPGMAAFNAWRNGGMMGAITAEDATAAKLASLIGSGNAAELVANSANLGVNLYNTTNSFMRGIANNTVDKELLSRYGLGGENGFSPAVTLSMTESETTTRYQTVSQGGVNRVGNVSLEAGEGIDLENGVKVHAGGNMDVNAPEIIATAAELHSSVDHKTSIQSVSFNPKGFQDASVSYSEEHRKSTNYRNAELSADGNMKLHNQDGAMGLVDLEGANIKAGTLDAKIDRLVIVDRQDTNSNTVKSASISTSGQISAYTGQGNSTITNQHSGIHVVEGINTGGHAVHVGEADMTGGKITTDGVNKIEIDKLVARTLQDEQHYSGVGVIFNVNDLDR